MRLAQRKQELDHQRLTQEKQSLEQEKGRMRPDQALMLSELKEINKKKLAGATLTELELTEDLLDASQSLRDALSEISAHSESVKPVKLINWVIKASTEVANQPQVQASSVRKKRAPGL